MLLGAVAVWAAGPATAAEKVVVRLSYTPFAAHIPDQGPSAGAPRIVASSRRASIRSRVLP